MASNKFDRFQDIDSKFWHLWQEYQDDLYRYCLRLMGGNPTEAEDALSHAMLKAREKLQNYTTPISNYKAWLTTLTRNVCIDIYRQLNKNPKKMESLEAMDVKENFLPTSTFDTPEAKLMRKELDTVIRDAIDDLPLKLREPSVLYFILEKSHKDIAQELAISYDNTRQRISQARSKLRKSLKEYFTGVDDVPSCRLAKLLQIKSKSTLVMSKRKKS